MNQLKSVRGMDGRIITYLSRCISDYDESESSTQRIEYMINLIVNGQANGDYRRNKEYPLDSKELLSILLDELQALWNKLCQDEKESKQND